MAEFGNIFRKEILVSAVKTKKIKAQNNLSDFPIKSAFWDNNIVKMPSDENLILTAGSPMTHLPEYWK